MRQERSSCQSFCDDEIHTGLDPTSDRGRTLHSPSPRPMFFFWVVLDVKSLEGGLWEVPDKRGPVPCARTALTLSAGCVQGYRGKR